MLECHPIASQSFMPLQNGDWLIIVSKGSSNKPNLDNLKCFIADTHHGVNYYPGTWHHPLITLEKKQDFLVIDRDNIEKENLTELEDLTKLIARKQVKDYNLSEAEEKELLEKHLQGYKSGGAHEIKSASDFINATSKTYDFVEYLWAIRGWQYDAFLCALPGIESVNAS